MAVPKRRMSRSRTRSRRAQWKAEPVRLVEVVVDGRSVHVPRRLARAVQRGLIDPWNPERGET
ncbi:50S ribosomal protein L32 [Cellulomonas sp. APG4]|uniref:50S ribosomal protein L32 n=1 Tax=Cellulomonas sp. APG4 TaxID=1538656 RepID=UPI00137A4B0D|nr:50S ribosomal protein L32 [Cellulomonas sp. APG4]NCT91546.1 50S ribosomal protein L32 [Cellulomonas sp. APG4]